MRAAARPFVREFKTRLRKTFPQSLDVCGSIRERSRAQPRHPDGATPNRVIAEGQLGQAQREAEAIFRQDDLSSESASLGQGDAQFTGRVLPCLLQAPASVASQTEMKTRVKPRNQRSLAVKQRLVSRSKFSPEMHAPVRSKGTQSTPWSHSVRDEFVKLSDLEMLSLIERAKAELLRRKEVGKERLRAEIEEKLKSAGLDLGDLFESERRSTRGAGKSKETDGLKAVAPKYKNHVTGETWSGRGRSPKWVAEILQEREWAMEEFKQSDEFLIA
jgi:DNA-binding protein H-NS